jgi:hypothetical protein
VTGAIALSQASELIGRLSERRVPDAARRRALPSIRISRLPPDHVRARRVAAATGIVVWIVDASDDPGAAVQARWTGTASRSTARGDRARWHYHPRRMARRAPEETVDRAYALRAQDEPVPLGRSRRFPEPSSWSSRRSDDDHRARRPGRLRDPSLAVRACTSRSRCGRRIQRDLGSRNGPSSTASASTRAQARPPGAEVVAGDVRSRSFASSCRAPLARSTSSACSRRSPPTGRLRRRDRAPQPMNQGAARSRCSRRSPRVLPRAPVGRRGAAALPGREPRRLDPPRSRRRDFREQARRARHRGGDGAPLPQSSASVEYGRGVRVTAGRNVPPRLWYPSSAGHDDLRASRQADQRAHHGETGRESRGPRDYRRAAERARWSPSTWQPCRRI